MLRAHNPNVTVPYIDWTIDARLPEPRDSILWSDQFLGDSRGKVTSGPFRYWPVLNKCQTHGKSLERFTDEDEVDKEALSNVIDSNITFHIV